MKRQMLLDRGVPLYQLKIFEYPSTSPKRVARIVTREITYKNKLNYKIAKKTQAQTPYIPPKLGKSAKRFEDRAHNVGFYHACVEARAPPRA